MQDTTHDVNLRSFEDMGTDVKFCPNCGTKNPGFARFCNQCGERLPDFDESPANHVDAQKTSAQPDDAAVERTPVEVVDATSLMSSETGEMMSMPTEHEDERPMTSEDVVPVESADSVTMDDDESIVDSIADRPKTLVDEVLQVETDSEQLDGFEGEELEPNDTSVSTTSKPDEIISGDDTAVSEFVEPNTESVDVSDERIDDEVDEGSIAAPVSDGLQSAEAVRDSTSSVDSPPKQRSKKLLWIIPVAAAAVALIGVFLWSPWNVAMPAGASDYVGRAGDAVLAEMTDLGFEDIHVVEVPNTSESIAGSVMRISVKGDAEFLAGERFPREDRIVITQYEGTYSGSPVAGEDDAIAQESDAVSSNESAIPVADVGATGEDDGLQYVVESDGNVTITKYTGDDTYVSISSEIDDHPVTKIADSAFEGCTSLQSITIWADITDLGTSAFKGCTALTSISLPSSLTSIKDSTFEGCTSLATALLWGDITNYGANCFKGCTALESMSIDNNTDRVGDSAFQGCTSLASVLFWGGKTIGKNAFQGCTALTDISIPSETTSIESKAFEGCTNLESVLVWPDEDEITIAPDAFENCPKADVQV